MGENARRRDDNDTRKRKPTIQKTIAEKIQIIREVDKKESTKTEIAKKYRMAPSTLSTILKNRDALEKRAADFHSDNTTRKRIREGKHSKLEIELFDWYCQNLANNVPISSTCIKEKAMGIAIEMGTSFSGSNGWLYRFLSRHNIDISIPQPYKKKESSIESNSIDIDLTQYSQNDIFSIDETSLFYATINDSPSECNLSINSNKYTDKLTVILCCNANGTEKLPPLIIGKHKRPIITEISKSLYEYNYNKNLTLTPDVFNEWLNRLELKIQNENRNILLLMEKFDLRVFKTIQLKCIKIQDITVQNNKFKPFRHGINRQLTRCYSNEIRDGIEESNFISETVKIVCDSWDRITPDFIKACFRKSGFVNDVLTANECNTDFDLNLVLEQSEHLNFVDTCIENKKMDNFESTEHTTTDDDEENFKPPLLTESVNLSSEDGERTQTPTAAIDTPQYRKTKDIQSIHNGTSTQYVSQDEHSVYGENVANRIRKLKDDYLTAIARNKIDKVLFEMEMLKFQNDISSASNSCTIVKEELFN